MSYLQNTFCSEVRIDTGERNRIEKNMKLVLLALAVLLVVTAALEAGQDPCDPNPCQGTNVCKDTSHGNVTGYSCQPPGGGDLCAQLRAQLPGCNCVKTHHANGTTSASCS
ncbi:uncharacterized protein LOC141906313 [Tubulanus polymorphus]|uniref:uncharacterized protein LOC141906313 n=1 Tax=Tubulanus polymorphus TaxID=672921 RepID=UPI003DA2DE03